MNKKDYLDKSTKKIYNSSARKIVIEELEGHIDTKAEFYKEIGYSDEASEEMAVEAMGDAELVADSFGEIHNDFYNPALDIATLLLHFGILGGIYYFIKNYISGDAGLFPIILSAVFLNASLIFADIALCLKRRRLVPSILSIVRLGGASALNYYLLSEIGKAANSSLSVLFDRAFKPVLLSASTHYDKNNVMLAVICFAAVSIIGIAVAVNWELKTRLFAIKRIDNKLRRSALRCIRYFAFLFIAAALFFGVKTYLDYEFYKKEYINAYKTVLELSEKCETIAEVDAYISDCSIDFQEDTATDGSVTGYSYYHNLVNLEIEYLGDDAVELDAEDNEKMNMYDVYSGFFNRNDYNTLYKIYFAVDSRYFDKHTDSFTLSNFIQLNYDKQDELTSLDLANADNETILQHYSRFVPNRLLFSRGSDDYETQRYSFSYIFGSGNTKYEETRTVSFINDYGMSILEETNKTAKILKANYDKSSGELAELTGATPRKMNYYAEVVGISLLNGRDYEIVQYVLHDDLYYVIGSVYENKFAIFYDGFRMINQVWLDADDNSILKYSNDYLKKLSINGYYYDKNGNCYTSPERVPYFTSDGRRFVFYALTQKNDPSIGDTKEYYLTDGVSYYPISICYVDDGGCLYIDSNGSITFDEGEYYKSPSGKRYIKAMNTSWDKDGTLLPYNEIYESELTL